MLVISKISFLFIILSSIVSAQAPKITSTMTMQELNKLAISDGAPSDYIGYSVAISDDTAVVGAYGDDVVSGSAHIFERNLVTGFFEQRVKLTASDANESDAFGYSVAISGDTVVVGAYSDDDNGSDSGSAYIFEKPVSGWIDANNEVVKLIASDANISDNFGYSVSISANTVLIGAYGNDDNGSDSGSAYIFEKPLSGWMDATSEDAKLTASDADISDNFGYSVAISGDTVVIGAYGNDDNGNDSGSAYIFEKGSAWTDSNQESAKLIASDAAAADYFAWSVAISDNTVVVGAYGDYLAGSAYIFEKPDLGWEGTLNQKAKLTASDGQRDDNFGWSVSISDETIIVGAYNDSSSNLGSVYIFRKPALEWVNDFENSKITASDAAENDYFASSVAISGDTVVIGAYMDDDIELDSGSAYIFKNAITENSIENKKDIIDIEASDAEGNDISFSIIGGLDAAYLRVDSDSGLLSFKTAPNFEYPRDSNADNIYEATLKLSDVSQSDTYKALIKVSDMAYEGVAPKALSFEELNKIGASIPMADANFGRSVAISGDIAVIGANNADGTGLAYIYEYQRESDAFMQKAVLSATDSNSGDSFGLSVAISGDTVVVGAYGHDHPTTDTGAVYVFEKPTTGNWVDATQNIKLSSNTGRYYDYFGYSVAISGDTIVVGARGDDDSGNNSGAAYVFEKPTSEWASISKGAKLTASDGTTEDRFGISVAISGDTVVVGADHNDNIGDDLDSTYVFEKPILGWANISQNAKLSASDGAVGDGFGRRVSVSGDTVVVGAYYDDNTYSDSGSVYIFEKPVLGWANTFEDAKLTASDAAQGDLFGFSVAISSDAIVVGSYLDDDSGNKSGAAYIFEKPNSGWVTSASENIKITASDATIEDYFSISVAISGGTIIVGSHGNDEDGNNAGAAYIFKAEKPNANPAIIMYLLN